MMSGPQHPPPADPPMFADLVDGRTARVSRVGVAVDTGSDPALVLAPPEGPTQRWPLAEVRRLPDTPPAGGIVLTSTGVPLARLYIAEVGVADDLAALCPGLNDRPPPRGLGRIAGWAAAAVGSVAAIVFLLVPLMANQLATVLPLRAELALGRTTLEQVRAALAGPDIGPLAICRAPDGLAALGSMQARLLGDRALPYDLTVTVLDHDLVNAFALPGGHVVFFRGLIDAAADPDEVAAVFAHEVGHVAARDPVRIALRSAGSVGVLGLLLGDFAGGAVVLFLTERLIQASYTRDAEAAADGFAIDMLIAAGIRPDALADLFETLRAEHGETTGLVAHFLSHPALGDRIARSRAASAAAGRTFTPSLDAAGWAALRNVCG